MVNTSRKAVKPQKHNTVAVIDPNYKLKQAIWIYFLLLIFEGALRKWILPFLSGPLLLVRDPVAIYIIVLAQQRGIIFEKYAKWMIGIGIVSFFTAILFGHGSFAVAIFGARIFVLHFPLIFIIGKVFNEQDVLKVGKVVAYISIPMILLVVMQFYSPQSAFVNRGVGGDESGAGFSGALGYLRPPGTFSFTNGNTLFFSFLAPFIFYFWLFPKYINRLLLIGATIALIASIPISISRALFLSIGVSTVFTVIAVSKKPAYLKRIVGAIVTVVILFLILSKVSIFQTAIEAFTARFDGANETEGGVESVVFDRYFGGLLKPFLNAMEQPFFGVGIGAGTTLGAQTLHFVTGPENEYDRIIWEQGMILGFGVIFIRLAFSIRMLIDGWKRLHAGNLLPWILLSFFLLNIPQIQWKQPTALGFSIMIGGLQLASLRSQKPKKRRLISVESTEVYS